MRDYKTRVGMLKCAMRWNVIMRDYKTRVGMLKCGIIRLALECYNAGL